jgi:hypothetical protein
MKRISLTLHNTTLDLISRQATKSGKKLQAVILETIMEAFPSDVFPCTRCGKIFSIESDEGSMRSEGTFCNKHLPKETEE